MEMWITTYTMIIHNVLFTSYSYETFVIHYVLERRMKEEKKSKVYFVKKNNIWNVYFTDFIASNFLKRLE